MPEAPQPTILIVDDEMDMRLFMSTLFETAGFCVALARDGHEGLDKARQIKPDLIVMDVMMPGEGGALMYKAVKADPGLQAVPVIMLSAVDQASFRHYLKMLNARLADKVPDPDAYMEKPPDPEVLLAMARKALSRPSPT